MAFPELSILAAAVLAPIQSSSCVAAITKMNADNPKRLAVDATAKGGETFVKVCILFAFFLHCNKTVPHDTPCVVSCLLYNRGCACECNLS